MIDRELDWPRLQKTYRQNDISIYHYPIDEQEANYHVKMYEVAQCLQGLVESKNKTVLVHCTSGVTRAPTVVLLHQCLYKKVQCW